MHLLLFPSVSQLGIQFDKHHYKQLSRQYHHSMWSLELYCSQLHCYCIYLHSRSYIHCNLHEQINHLIIPKYDLWYRKTAKCIIGSIFISNRTEWIYSLGKCLFHPVFKKRVVLNMTYKYDIYSDFKMVFPISLPVARCI